MARAAALAAAHSEGASKEAGVAVGFSQGSYVVLDLVKTSFASFRGLVLLGAELHPNVKTLRDAGVKRVALGAGRYDSIPYASLQDEAVRLENEGLEARFYDLGKVGHTYLVDDPSVLRDAIAWAAAGTDGRQRFARKDSMRAAVRARKPSSMGGQCLHCASSSVSARGKSSFARASSGAPGKLASSSAPSTSTGPW